MLYKESINDADIAYLRITTSTVRTLYVYFYLFSLIKTVLNVKIYTKRYRKHQMCILGKCIYMYMCYINDLVSLQLF